LRERPDLVYVSGPPTYLQCQIGREAVQRGVDNLVRLVGDTGCRVIVDHHAVREPRFRDRLAQAFATGRVMTAAEFLGRGDECLEARRAALWARRRRGRPDGREAAAGP
jgi:predicted metallo-beta-lactamase superfamily hydrolase